MGVGMRVERASWQLFFARVETKFGMREKSDGSKAGLHAKTLVTVSMLIASGCEQEDPAGTAEVEPVPSAPDYQWTTDHMHVGVRWQPFDERPQNNAYDATRPVISEDSSYAQFWMDWSEIEPEVLNTDYAAHRTAYLAAIETAVDACVARGLKVEFVFWFCPAWASVSGEAGPWKPKPGYYPDFVGRIARHFKGRVSAYQLAHEANLKSLMQDGDIDFVVGEIFTEGARTIRSVYEQDPPEPVLISTSGCSPCVDCPAIDGLDAIGGFAINNFYDRLIAAPAMMELVDALNLNVSDQNDGYGFVEDPFVTSSWSNYDLVRNKLDVAGYRNKAVLAAESWISWDGSVNAVDVNGDGIKDERDAWQKALVIIGNCLERGLNTINLPWSDNSSGWSMGLTKRRDYNGRIRELDPTIVIPASDGGPDIVTSKVKLEGTDDDFVLASDIHYPFTVEHYINPPDPNHLHYYIWRWYAKIAAGSDEVIRHALAGEEGNDIVVSGEAFTGERRYRIASYNRSRGSFRVLLYAQGADGKANATVSIPATIQQGYHYNNDASRLDFRGEGFADGQAYRVLVESKDIDAEHGGDRNVARVDAGVFHVQEDTLSVTVENMRPFTCIDFVAVAAH
jgi:hypothetical protein